MFPQYVALDLEMTGTDLDKDGIIEVGAVKFGLGGVRERFCTLVNPGRALPRRIESLTGIKAAELGAAPPFDDVADKLVRFVGDAPVVGQRIDWDLKFLHKHGLVPDGPVFDTAELAELLIPGLPDYGLLHMTRRFGIDFPVQHRALPDAEAAMQVFLALLDRAELIEPQVLDEIVRLTADSTWPLRYLFRDVAARARRVAAGRPADLDGLPLDVVRRGAEAGPALVANEHLKPVTAEEVCAVFEAAAADPERFPNFEQRREQAAMAGAVAESLSAEGRLIVEAGTGTGKALDVDTPIPTPDGWVRMGDLNVGDRVFDERGRPCTVIGAFDVMRDRPCYEVRLSDGAAIVADAEHLWATTTRQTRRRATRCGSPSHRAELRVVTTAEVASTLRTVTGHRNHAVPVSGPLDLPDRELPIDPYVLGVWLGDGTVGMCQFTTADEEVAEQVSAAGYLVRKRMTSRYAYVVNLCSGPGKNRFTPSFTRLLRGLGVLHDKHIPDAYLRASVAQRFALLQGLMDTDGEASRSQLSYCSTNERLAKDVLELAASLGYRPTLMEKPAYAYINRERIPCGTAYLVGFTTLDPVFRLKRKLAAQRERLANHEGRRTGLRYIVDVVPVPSRPVRCIAVDSPNRLFLAGRAMIPTHNSLAYLVPAACFALRNNARVLVTTNTINLQEQITGKDAPELVRLLEAGAPPDLRRRVSDLRVTQLKGRRNYLCLQRLAAMQRAGAQSDAEARFLTRLLLWLQVTDTGDRAELTLRPDEEPLWTRVSAQDTTCFAGPSYYVRNGTCQLLRARKRAAASHIVVANHALLLSDLAAGGQALPPYEHLVVDEAHNLEDEATSQFGFQAGQGHFLEYLDRLVLHGPTGDRGLVADVHEALRLVPENAPAARLHKAADLVAERVERARELIPEVFARVRAFVADHGEAGGDYDNRLLLTAAKRAQPEWEHVELAWENARVALLPVEDALVRLNVALAEANGAAILDYDTLLGNVATITQNGLQLRKGVDEIIEKHDGDRIAWITTHRTTGAVNFSSAPLNVGDVLEDYLFGRKASVVLTSATLSTGGTFKYVKERLGLQEADEALLGSPFDYKRAALVLLPTDVPEPSYREYQRAVEDGVVSLCTASQGRALVLFTSHSALRATHAAVKRPLERAGVRVLGQGIDGTPKEILEALRANPQTVLLGTSSFWEGVDVVGEALSLLIIAKLPFSVPTDPVFSARSALFDEPFMQYALPQAVLRFKQGFGRLIRHKTDRGVMVVLDRRLTSKKYGRLFLESLPSCSISQAPLAQLPPLVSRWLSGRAGLALTPGPAPNAGSGEAR